jgi:hypothetical protein
MKLKASNRRCEVEVRRFQVLGHYVRSEVSIFGHFVRFEDNVSGLRFRSLVIFIGMRSLC